MPKILSVPGQEETFSPMKNSYNNKFARLDNNPNLRNSQYYNPIVPIHQVSYNPEYSKSPLASVEMSRKGHIKPIHPVEGQVFNNNDAGYHGQQDSNSENLDWKKILCWALIALAIIALAIGLYFLIDSILGRKSSKGNQTAQVDQSVYLRSAQNTNSDSQTGLNPILVNPVPYNSLNGPSASISTNPTVTQYSTGTSSTSEVNSNPTTSPSSSTSGSSTSANTAITKPNADWTVNPSDNSISPLNVYQMGQR